MAHVDRQSARRPTSRRTSSATSTSRLLRFITCGSVDDGKSTLIGRLLYESKLVFEDQLAALEADSKKVGTQGGELDFALLVDGLAAEREQGITIDVAYRFFSTEQRKFIVADTPGHEQYTRNMVTGASTADLAVILIDARKGVLTQTRRHSYPRLAARHPPRRAGGQQARPGRLLRGGLRHRSRPTTGRSPPRSASDRHRRASRCRRCAATTSSSPARTRPGTRADADRAPRDRRGRPTTSARGPFRMPVQWVQPAQPRLPRLLRPDRRRHASGRATGCACCPRAARPRVARIVTVRRRSRRGRRRAVGHAHARRRDRRQPRRRARAPPATRPRVADQFEAHVVWMSEEPMLPGRPYLLKLGSRTVGATHRPAEVQGQRQHARAPGGDDAGAQRDRRLQPQSRSPGRRSTPTPRTATWAASSSSTGSPTTPSAPACCTSRCAAPTTCTGRPIEVDKRRPRRAQGPAPGRRLVHRPLRRGQVDHRQPRRAASCTRSGRHTYLLDGDNVRHGLNTDLGFTDADRVENIRRVAEVARLMVDAGLIVLVSLHLAVPGRAAAWPASCSAEGEFFEVFVDTPLEVAEARDRKGLYAKARRGELAQLHRHRLALRAAGVTRAPARRQRHGAGSRQRRLGHRAPAPSRLAPTENTGMTSMDPLTLASVVTAGETAAGTPPRSAVR